MNAYTLLIKNMVCQRCIMAVENLLLTMEIVFKTVALGEVVLEQAITQGQKAVISLQLRELGFELMDNHKSILIEKMKQIIIDRARNGTNEKNEGRKLSAEISASLYHEYTHLSSLFSSVEGRTVENYFIEQRIEKVKELLVYNELSLAQIARLYDYSSTAYLSNQFKRVTGFNPTTFKLTHKNTRKSLSQV